MLRAKKKEQQPTELHIIDATDFQPSTYVNKDGRYYHRDNIFAPRKDESIHDESYKKECILENIVHLLRMMRGTKMGMRMQ